MLLLLPVDMTLNGGEGLPPPRCGSALLACPFSPQKWWPAFTASMSEIRVLARKMPNIWKQRAAEAAAVSIGAQRACWRGYPHTAHHPHTCPQRLRTESSNRAYTNGDPPTVKTKEPGVCLPCPKSLEGANSSSAEAQGTLWPACNMTLHVPDRKPQHALCPG